MSDAAVFAAMAANVAALIDAKSSGVTDAAALTAINDRLDAIAEIVNAQGAAPTAISAVAARVAVTAELTDADLGNLRGMDCNTGKLIGGLDYLRQRVTDALLTPKASQVLLRARGSDAPDLIDQPMNQQGKARLIMAVACALSDPLAGVPDFRLRRVALADIGGAMQGRFGFTLTGQWLARDVEVTL